jgi:hypothetical protein
MNSQAMGYVGYEDGSAEPPLPPPPPPPPPPRAYSYHHILAARSMSADNTRRNEQFQNRPLPRHHDPPDYFTLPPRYPCGYPRPTSKYAMMGMYCVYVPNVIHHHLQTARANTPAPNSDFVAVVVSAEVSSNDHVKVVTLRRADGGVAAKLTRSNHFATTPGLVMTIYDHRDVYNDSMRLVFASVGVVHGLTSGGEAWAIYDGDQPNDVFVKETTLMFGICRDEISLHDNVCIEALRDNSTLGKDTVVTVFASRGLGKGAFNTYQKLGSADAPAFAARQCTTPLHQATCDTVLFQPDAVVHPQAAALRMLAYEVATSRDSFQLVDIKYSWSAATGTSAIVRTRGSNAWYLQSPVLAYRIVPLPTGTRQNV